jgi:large subunit ribosomal protein L4
MTSISSINIKGEQAEKVKLSEKVFGVRGSSDLSAVAVQVYLANQRKSNAKTKTRSEVQKTTAKMYKQKGTGRARHGAYSAPIFVGGGIAHGPDGTQNYKKVLTKKSVRIALISALSEKAAENNLYVLSEEAKLKGKTKEIIGIVKMMQGDNNHLLVVSTDKETLVRRAFQNASRITVSSPKQLNTYTIIRNSKLLFTSEALKETTTLLEKK